MFAHQWSDGCCSIWARRARSGCGSPRTGLPEITFGRIQCTATIIFCLQKKKKTLWEASSRRRQAAAHFSKWLHFLASYTFSICLSRRLTVDHVNMCSSQPGCATDGRSSLLLDSVLDEQPNLSNQLKKLLGYEVLHVLWIPFYPCRCNTKLSGWVPGKPQWVAKKNSWATSGNIMMR